MKIARIDHHFFDLLLCKAVARSTVYTETNRIATAEENISGNISALRTVTFLFLHRSVLKRQ
jgi:hypothetical protein